MRTLEAGERLVKVSYSHGKRIQVLSSTASSCIDLREIKTYHNLTQSRCGPGFALTARTVLPAIPDPQDESLYRVAVFNFHLQVGEISNNGRRGQEFGRLSGRSVRYLL